jgi:diguanylate cyclase (GGDEF)-like protein
MSDVPLRNTINQAIPRLLPWLVLFVALGVTWVTWDHERQTTRNALRSQFEFSLRETVSRIDQRLVGYEQMLRGVQSLFATTSLKNRAAMRDYVEALQLDANFSGVQVIGAVEWVPAADEAKHVSAMRSAGFTDYQIEPVGPRDAFAPIVQREPYVGRNRAPLGSDVWSDSVRRLALERARDSGMAAISGKVRLKVDTEANASPGFILYLPIYAHGQPHDNVAQRRANLIGWVYAAFRMNDFMASLYGGQSPGLVLAIHDGTDPTKESLMYRSAEGNQTSRASSTHSAISANEYLVVAGHNWTLTLRTLDAFEDQYGRSAQNVIAISGTVLSLLLSLLAWQLVNGRERALHIASSMTNELRHMAQHDPLTGLPNRALFNDRLSQELARAKRHDGRFAMAFVDLDRFKSINDNHGHDVGDQLLQQVAGRLSDCIRAADTVGRLGGDEFVALMEDLSDRDTLLALAEKIRLAMHQPFFVNGLELNISCSIGIAVYPEDGSSAVALTKSADEAMYQAKEAGRNCVRLRSSGR